MKKFFYDVLSHREITGEQTACIDSKWQSIPKEVLFFDTAAFHQLHEKNCEELYLLIVVQQEEILGFCYLGLRQGILRLGYSSPFANVYLWEEQRAEKLPLLLQGLKALSEKCGAGLSLTLPPDIYEEQLAVKLGAFLDEGFRLEYAHVNSYFDLSRIDSMEDFLSERPHSYRKNWKRAEKRGLVLHHKEKDPSLLQRAYGIIEQNRREKGYPLAMSLRQVEDIAMLEDEKLGSPVEAFTVTSAEADQAMAAALVFRVTPFAYQVVYWGSLQEYNEHRPMEFLSQSLVAYYKEKGAKYLDIGPATAEGKISYGLLKFKENIGCRVNMKPVLRWEKSGL